MKRAKWTVVVKLPEPWDIVVHGFNSYEQARAALAAAELAVASRDAMGFELLDAQGRCVVDSEWVVPVEARAVPAPGRYRWDEAAEALRAV